MAAPRVCTWFALAPLLLIALAPQGTRATNILCILSTPTKSHHIWSSPLIQALAAKGYNMTVLSPTAMKPPVPNITDLVIEDALTVQDVAYDYATFTTLKSYEWIPMTYDWYLYSCNYSLSTKGVKQLYDYPDDFRFDLIIIEASGGECMLGFIEKFGRPPVVAINGFGNPQWINWNAGNPDHPAYVSNAQLSIRWPFSFIDKLHNIALYCYSMYYYYMYHLPDSDKLLKEFFMEQPWASQIPPASETLANASLLLVNAHYSVDGARPMIPSMIPVGGLHIRPPKPLPKELQQWLDGASEADGAVLFSLGSIVRSDRIGAQQRDAMLTAFAATPRVRFLWKWEKDEPPGPLPPNVRVGKWLPQNDILAHPKLRAFISHSGMLSTHEATWWGVPVVAMPFIVDQHLNAHRLVGLGVAEHLEYTSLTKEKVLDKLNKVLGDPGYRERMRHMSSLFRSRPELPLDTAVFWIEHVLRHGGAPGMRCPTSDIPWYSLALLDVAAVVIAPLVAGLLLTSCVIRAAKKVITKKQKAD